MKRMFLLLTLCGCDEAIDPAEFRQAPAVLKQAPESCPPSFTLRLEQRPDGWSGSLVVVMPDCDGNGAGWFDGEADCEIIADVARDSCEQISGG